MMGQSRRKTPLAVLDAAASFFIYDTGRTDSRTLLGVGSPYVRLSQQRNHDTRFLAEESSNVIDYGPRVEKPNFLL